MARDSDRVSSLLASTAVRETAGLKIQSVRLDRRGAEVEFNLPLCPKSVRVDLYGPGTGTFPTFALLGADGLVPGSAVCLEGGRVLAFHPRGGVLSAGDYSIRLQAGPSGLRGLGGAEVSTDDVSTTGAISLLGVVGETANRTLTLPSFARGPGQKINVPVPASGLPLVLSDGADITALDVLLQYDPDLIDIDLTSVATSADMLAAKFGGSLEVTCATPGRLRLALRADKTLPHGRLEILRLQARVPESSPYGRAHRIEIAEVSARTRTGETLPISGVGGLHVTAYLGDTTGNAGYSALDAQRALAFALGTRPRLPEWPHLDPLLIADVTADGRVTRDDAEIIMRRVVGMSAVEIPALTGAVEPVFEGGPDPFVNIPKDLSARPNDTVDAPVMIDQANGLESLDMELAFDPTTLEYQSTELGSLITNPQAIFLPHLNAAGDTVTLGVAIPIPLSEGGGELVAFDFKVATEAGGGPTPLNITFACLNEEGLTLNPAPENEPGDPTDGVVTVIVGCTFEEPIDDQVVNEGEELSFTPQVTDPVEPIGNLAFSLENPPAGATVDPDTGAFSWTPNEAQGPGLFNFTLRAVDAVEVDVSCVQEFQVVVMEVNAAPILDPIGNQSVVVGEELAFVAVANDPDFPANGLTFSLEEEPVGAAIDLSTGAFTWTPDTVGDFSLTVVVTDDGDPNLRASETITVNVTAAGTPFVRGEVNSDGGVNIADPIFILNFLFGGGPGPTCRKTADVNDDSGVNIADGIYLLNFLFGGGPPPPPPNGTAPANCGLDPTEDTLPCESYEPCE